MFIWLQSLDTETKEFKKIMRAEMNSRDRRRNEDFSEELDVDPVENK
jgi:hypothetical protein